MRLLLLAADPLRTSRPESKGIVEAGVRYVKHNALAGRAEELVHFEDTWRSHLAGVTRWPTCGFMRRPASGQWITSPASTLAAPQAAAIPFDTDEVVPAVVSPHARIEFDGNRYSAPPTGCAR